MLMVLLGLGGYPFFFSFNACASASLIILISQRERAGVTGLGPLTLGDPVLELDCRMPLALLPALRRLSGRSGGSNGTKMYS